jgi:hypothetical protein
MHPGDLGGAGDALSLQLNQRLQQTNAQTALDLKSHMVPATISRRYRRDSGSASLQIAALKV